VTETSVRAQLVVLRERGWVHPGYSGRQELNFASPAYRENAVRIYTTVQPTALWPHLVQRLSSTRTHSWSLQPERVALGYCVVRAHLWLGRSADEAEAMLAPHALASYLPQWADQIF
jgi:hypothetical protein